MFFLRLAALMAAIASILGGIVHAQTIVTVEVGSGGALTFRDQASGSTSSAGIPAVTRIHEGDTVLFTWQGSNHNISPYDTVLRNAGYSVPFTSAAIMGITGWDPTARLSNYRCTLHSSLMTGRIYIFEAAKGYGVAAPASVNAGSPFSITVTATGQNNTTDALYRGTIQFSSSDTNANVQLPANYTFVAADNGTHTFNGLVLRTAASSATIRISEVGGTGLTGQATLRVDAAAPNPPENLRVVP